MKFWWSLPEGLPSASSEQPQVDSDHRTPPGLHSPGAWACPKAVLIQDLPDTEKVRKWHWGTGALAAGPEEVRSRGDAGLGHTVSRR